MASPRLSAVLGNVETGPDPSSDDADVNVALGWDGDSAVDPRWGVIVKGTDLGGAGDALELARRCGRFERANWTIAVVVGGLAVGLAASGLAGPVLTALAVNAACAGMMAVRPRPARDR